MLPSVILMRLNSSHSESLVASEFRSYEFPRVFFFPRGPARAPWESLGPCLGSAVRASAKRKRRLVGLRLALAWLRLLAGLGLAGLS